ncbi:hypothetical protein DPX16_17337 [Anabarilius grahami]|uniref:Uncharacterized protein n=1 Tax=Anabarilius grahami TaxID=495550 RepID=A0A3N0XYP6_ANAGA|nr:hypothetical protein DPX16_17337 [Anabarilius grahami]
MRLRGQATLAPDVELHQTSDQGCEPTTSADDGEMTTESEDWLIDFSEEITYGPSVALSPSTLYGCSKAASNIHPDPEHESSVVFSSEHFNLVHKDSVQSHGNQRDLNRWGRAAFVRESPLGGRLLKPDNGGGGMLFIYSHVNHESSEEAGSSLTAQSSVAFHRQSSEAQEYFLHYG